MGYLSAWSQSCARPVVLFLDEIDALKGSPLLSVPHQLRDGFRLDRPTTFPLAAPGSAPGSGGYWI